MREQLFVHATFTVCSARLGDVDDGLEVLPHQVVLISLVTPAQAGIQCEHVVRSAPHKTMLCLSDASFELDAGLRRNDETETHRRVAIRTPQ